ADGGSGCGDRIPAAAEAGEALALRLARLRVLDEVVERVAGVGDLDPAVAAPAGAEKRRLCSARGDRPSAGYKRGPVLGTVAVSGALRALVVRPDVERLAVGVDEDAAEAARSDLHDRAAVGRARSGNRERRRCDEHADRQRQDLQELHAVPFRKRNAP